MTTDTLEADLQAVAYQRMQDFAAEQKRWVANTARLFRETERLARL